MIARRKPLKRGWYRRKVHLEPPELTESRYIVKNRARGWCEAKVSPYCRDRGTMAHHRLSRRYNDHSPENLVWICGPCHDWVHAHPKDSYLNGLMIRGNR